MIWPWACRLWLAAPLVGWWVGASSRNAQLAWWTLASVLVLCVGWTQPPRREAKVFGGLVAVCLVVFLSHLGSLGTGLLWLLQAVLVLCAAALIAERGEFRWLRQALLRSGSA